MLLDFRFREEQAIYAEFADAEMGLPVDLENGGRVARGVVPPAPA